MALRLELEERVPDGIRRILDEALAEMESTLGSESVKNGRAVHKTRRGCKRIRALLRMVRSDLGTTWAFENRWYRDLSRSLSSARDADVCVATLDRLQKRYEGLVRPKTFKVAGSHLRRSRAEGRPTLGRVRSAAADEVRKARARVDQLPLSTDNFELVSLGLAVTHRRGAQLFRRARKTGKPECFHDLRKRVKYLNYQVGVLEASAPLLIPALTSELATLGDVLGDAQDLDLLRGFLAEMRPSQELEVIRALAVEWESLLHREALDRGRSVFGRETGAFIEDLEVHWVLWKGLDLESRGLVVPAARLLRAGGRREERKAGGRQKSPSA